LAHAIHPKNEKVTLVVLDKRGKTPEIQRTGQFQARDSKRMTRDEYLMISGAREFLRINDGVDENKMTDADLNDRLKVSTIGKNTMLQKTMPAMNRSKGSLNVKDLNNNTQGMSLINTSTDPMQESLFSKSIQRGKLTVVERPEMSVSLKNSFLEKNRGRQRSDLKTRNLNIIRYGSLNMEDDVE
jgi:hypothetical protein